MDNTFASPVNKSRVNIAFDSESPSRPSTGQRSVTRPSASRESKQTSSTHREHRYKESPLKTPSKLNVNAEDQEQREGEEEQQETNQVVDNIENEQDELNALVGQHSRRLKRDIQNNLSASRKAKGSPELHFDPTATLIADDYAEFLKNNEHDKEVFRQLCDEFGNFGSLKVIYGSSNFEEGEEIVSNFKEEAVDLGYTLLESQNDREVLLGSEINHIGLGMALTKEKLVIVALVSEKLLTVTKIREAKKGQQGIEVHGRMLVNTHGVYALRVQNTVTKKELALVGPENISFNLDTKEFVAFLPLEEGQYGPQVIVELYIRKKAETIEYKQARKEKINLQHLELAFRCPCEVYPVDKTLEEDEEDRRSTQKKEAENRKAEEAKRQRREEESVERKEVRRNLREAFESAGGEGLELKSNSPIAVRRRKKFLEEQAKAKKEKLLRTQTTLQSSQQMDQESNEEGQEQKESIEQIGEENEQAENGEEMAEDDTLEAKEDGDEADSVKEGENQGSRVGTPSKGGENTRIRMELDTAIEDVKREQARLEERNLFLQRLVFDWREKKDLQIERHMDVGMNEGKYVNMLAHVHQIRVDLKTTQDRYNAMARDLQQKLDAKQTTCAEIKNGFRSLLREVSQNAAYSSKNDKPIGDKKIQEWEQAEEERVQVLQALRLENVRLKNTLAKDQQTLQKKDELADGLHMIDYEQLKIENQTLREKIEERSENLHRLMKNNTGVVQEFTHLKEKRDFVLKENTRLATEGETLDTEIIELRTKANELKKDNNRYKSTNEEMKQQTGIMTNPNLRADYENVIAEVKADKATRRYLEAKLNYLTEAVQGYASKNKWKKVIGSPKKC